MGIVTIDYRRQGSFEKTAYTGCLLSSPLLPRREPSLVDDAILPPARSKGRWMLLVIIVLPGHDMGVRLLAARPRVNGMNDRGLATSCMWRHPRLDLDVDLALSVASPSLVCMERQYDDLGSRSRREIAA
ncbi:hypothetical protein DL765_006034 [Monosporascus sp. GIB2]|nr:hypothetical protein DL765_006034 [Monosporascus sp. GIB2]